MHAPFAARSGQAASVTTFGFRLAVLLLPALLLLGGSLRHRGDTGQILLFGAAFQMFVCTLGLLTQAFWRRSVGPADLDACRTLPEVKALREALHLDAAPVIPLLHCPRPQVQIAALAALDFRKHWRPGQAEAVLQVALRAEQSAVRAAALSALANIEDRVLIESLAEFLRDPSSQVRRAAAEALLWDSERRWIWIRYAVRRSLGDALCQEDGPLRLPVQPLPGEAV